MNFLSRLQSFAVLNAVYFDVLLISLSLKDPDGVDIAMDAEGYQRGVKVIVVGGRAAPESLHSFIDAYVHKPFSLQWIDATVKKVLTSAAPILAV